MVQCRAARWVKNDYVQQSPATQMLIDFKWQDLAQRRADVTLSLIYKTVYNIVLIEAITYAKRQRNLINIQQILANKKYYNSMYIIGFRIHNK